VEFNVPDTVKTWVGSQSPFSSGEVFHIGVNGSGKTFALKSQSPFSSGEVFHQAIVQRNFFCLPRKLSQSPFSSGEVFHSNYKDIPVEIIDVIVSQSPFSSGEVFHMPQFAPDGWAAGIEGLNPLLVAGKYSTRT